MIESIAKALKRPVRGWPGDLSWSVIRDLESSGIFTLRDVIVAEHRLDQVPGVGAYTRSRLLEWTTSASEEAGVSPEDLRLAAVWSHAQDRAIAQRKQPPTLASEVPIHLTDTPLSFDALSDLPAVMQSRVKNSLWILIQKRHPETEIITLRKTEELLRTASQTQKRFSAGRVEWRHAKSCFDDTLSRHGYFVPLFPASQEL